jgi:Glu-tRNA(Gln) amidotransferase subunit E-like FAD-binding protein
MDLDYKKLGLKAGIEIHQQLDSKKLYCRCPSMLRKDEPDFTVERKLHAVAGEGGEVDVAAKHEASINKTFIYQGYDDTTCLIELDEEPPRLINKEALETALQISLLLNCKIVPISQIMRKTVIDGSNTSGFQRTVLIARDGFAETPTGKVGIWYVYLEEDAARKVSAEAGKTTYRLDRLGIPLVEIVTAPDITTPQQAKEVALHIGELLRACKVKRGLGTIRQDINVSIKGHPRAEIKGFQDPKIFVDVVNKEIERQLADLKEKNEKELKAEVRVANEDASTSFQRPLPSSARMYPETDLPLLKISKQMIDKAKKTLPKLKSDTRQELRKEGMNEELVSLLLQKEKLAEYKDLFAISRKPNLIAKMILLWRQEIAIHKNMKLEEIEEILNTDLLEDILKALNQGKLKEDDIKAVMREISEGKKLQEALAVEKTDTHEVEETMINLMKEKPGLSEGAYMGLLMAKFKGKISGKELMELIKKHLK